MASRSVDDSIVVGKSGFLFVPGDKLCVNANIDAMAPDFAEAWCELPIDPYIDKLRPYRYRRHSMVVFKTGERDFEHLPHVDYQQAERHNPLFGGIARRFSPILWDAAIENTIFSIVETTITKCLGLSGDIHVNLHMVRIVGTSNYVGAPAPEGPHRDGFEFISVHLVKRDVDTGGETSVLDDDDRELSKVTLQDPLDSIIIDDQRLKHYTSPIEAQGRRSHRDVLLMSFDRASHLC